MAHQRKTWKRFMETILSQLPSYIKKYPPSDQVILNEFLSSLQLYQVDTQTNRNQLITRFKELILQYHESQDFLDLPFLWFVESYLSNASRLLSVALYHADDFYKYLVSHLSGYSNKKGFFQLIVKKTPLTDLSWEKLQYSCMKLSIPLTSEELHILEAIFDSCVTNGINALNPSHLTTTIGNQIKSRKISKNLVPLFSRLDTLWRIHFYNPAFDLQKMNLHFQLNESSSLKEIIDFYNPANTTLCNSYIYQIRGFHNMFYGLLVIPSHLVERLRIYLQKCERQGKLIILELSKVTISHYSSSLSLYQANKGWRNPTMTDRRRLTPLLKTERPRKKRVKFPSFYQTPPYNDYWHYKQYPKPTQTIALFCKVPRELSFKELSLYSDNKQSNIRLSKPEFDLLKELYHNQVINSFFLSYRLFNEFSLDNYWIRIPKIPLDQLSRLLAWLPFSYFVVTETGIYLQSFLTPELVKWIRNDLEWPIMPIIRNHLPQRIVFDWYAPEESQWRTPLVLKQEN